MRIFSNDTGDARFVEKAIERITSMMNRTKIVILATRPNFTISQYCNKILWMEKGKVKAIGTVDEIIPKFEAETSTKI